MKLPAIIEHCYIISRILSCRLRCLIQSVIFPFRSQVAEKVLGYGIIQIVPLAAHTARCNLPFQFFSGKAENWRDRFRLWLPIPALSIMLATLRPYLRFQLPPRPT